ncbi:hypothetical protein ACLB2K_026562 [Fragaria x ananassa]
MATYRALLSLKSSLDDPDSRLSSWTPNTSHCNNNVSNNVFNRTFLPELSNLTNLRVLDLYNNNLTGVLPVSVAHMTNLRHLHLERDRVWFWCAAAAGWASEEATRGGGSVGSGSGASEAGGVARQATVCGGCSGRGNDDDGIDEDGLGSRVVESKIGGGGLVVRRQ